MARISFATLLACAKLRCGKLKYPTKQALSLEFEFEWIGSTVGNHQLSYNPLACFDYLKNPR